MYLLLQLPGLLPPEQHLVPGFLIGVGHQRVSVIGPQLREETAVRAGEDSEAGLEGQSQRGSGCVGGRGRAEGACRREAKKGQAGSHPLPGFLQVTPQDFADLLLLVLGQCWQDAF